MLANLIVGMLVDIKEDNMKKILGVEVTDEEFDRLFCAQATGKELKLINGVV